jgi:hypothetical protein
VVLDLRLPEIDVRHTYPLLHRRQSCPVLNSVRIPCGAPSSRLLSDIRRRRNSRTDIMTPGDDWLMPLPPLRGDVFHVIGFTSQDPLAGAPLELTKRLRGMPARGSGKQLVEVYFLDPLVARDPSAITEYGSYLSVFYYSDTALKLSKRFGIELPPEIATRTREQLPLGLGTSLIMPFPD